MASPDAREATKRRWADSCPPLMPAPAPLSPNLPGILTVTLYEGFSLSVAEQHHHLFEGYECKSGVEGWYYYERRFYAVDALLEYDKSQASLESIAGDPSTRGSGTTENPQWGFGDGAVCKFDVSRSAELRLALYVNDLGAHWGSQSVLLGETKLAPFEILPDGEKVTGWLELTSGTGKILIGLEYSHFKRESFECDDRLGFGILSSARDVIRVREKETRRAYAEVGRGCAGA